jgi:tRNA pseudouridine55 synthase
MAKRKSGLDVNGIMLLDKRIGISSNQALQEVRRLFNANKAGHTGSLDPLASGVLPLCFGEATKISGMLLNENKRYDVVMRLGEKTDTGDAEGQVILKMPVPALSTEQVAACLADFSGEIEQIPPMYSALKHNGRKLYELAREGKCVDRKARRIKIFKLQIIALDRESLRLDVLCSKGTYIRTLVEDIAEKLGSCAHVSVLRRTAAGMFSIDRCLTFDALHNLTAEALHELLLPVDAPLGEIPAISLSDQQSLCFRQGQQVPVVPAFSGMVRIYNREQFLGLGELSLNGKLAPKKLFQLKNHI